MKWIWTMCFFSFSLFAGFEEFQIAKRRILEQIASVQATLELCIPLKDDSDKIIEQENDCRRADLLLLERLQNELRMLNKFDDPLDDIADLQKRLKTSLERHGELLMNEIRLPLDKRALLNDKVKELKKIIKEAQEKSELFNRKHAEHLDRHYRNLDDDDEYTPDAYEDVNELARARDLAIETRNLAIEELRNTEQQIAELGPQETEVDITQQNREKMSHESLFRYFGAS
ncbi:MAG: hypothetical protein WCK49_00095 [Myxococcaceae bacterium]